MKNAITTTNNLHFPSFLNTSGSNTLKLKMHNQYGYIKEEEFQIGNTLGRGSYAYCIEIIHTSTNQAYACKVFKKSKIISYESRMRILIEVSIHKKLNHKNIVKFYSVASTSDNVFILLEKCNNRTLKQLLSTRKKFQENEVRYFMYQIIYAIDYLHANNICHRDLKLDNIFLKDMTIKLGDFGFAVKLQSDETSSTFCGTPNYIAPEIISKTGYRMPVDIWAVGVLMYGMIFGVLPFETHSSEVTFEKISKNNYVFPKNCDISADAKNLIKSCLSHYPKDRPTSGQLLKHPFFTSCDIPSLIGGGGRTLLSVLSSGNLKRKFCSDTENLNKRYHYEKENQNPNAPRFDRKANQDENYNVPLQKAYSSAQNTSHKNRIIDICTKLQEFCKKAMSFSSFSPLPSQSNSSSREHYHETMGHHWIVKWVDYSQKFGLAYKFCDGSFGVNFCDGTRMRLYSNNEKLIYSSCIGQGGASKEVKHRVDKVYNLLEEDKKMAETPDVGNKFKILNHFVRFMDDFPVSNGLDVNCQASNEDLESTGLLRWTKKSTFIAFLFTNYTVQTLDDVIITWIASKNLAVTKTAHDFIQQGYATLYIIERIYEILEILTNNFV